MWNIPHKWTTEYISDIFCYHVITMGSIEERISVEFFFLIIIRNGIVLKVLAFSYVFLTHFSIVLWRSKKISTGCIIIIIKKD